MHFRAEEGRTAPALTTAPTAAVASWRGILAPRSYSASALMMSSLCESSFCHT